MQKLITICIIDEEKLNEDVEDKMFRYVECTAPSPLGEGGGGRGKILLIT